MAKHLYPCLWFDGNIAEATHFYCSLFENSNVLAENSIVTKFEIEGTTIKLLNGGTLFTKNPSISFYVSIIYPSISLSYCPSLFIYFQYPPNYLLSTYLSIYLTLCIS